jgi:hypothetical protein
MRLKERPIEATGEELIPSEEDQAFFTKAKEGQGVKPRGSRDQARDKIGAAKAMEALRKKLGKDRKASDQQELFK